MKHGIIFPKDDTPRVYLSTVNKAIAADSTSELDLLLSTLKEAFEDNGKFLVYNDNPAETFRSLDREGEVEDFSNLCWDKREAGKLIVWGED